MTAWQPIETAPKDGTKVIVFIPGSGAVCPAWWEVDKYAVRPRPYWTHWGEHVFGVRQVRNKPPTHWMPIPPAPAKTAVEGA